MLDRRVRKTRRTMRECLTKLLKEKKIQDITVRELADMADINRGTFYLHYKDVFDLLEQLEQELTEDLENILDHHSVDELLSQPSLLFSDLYPTVQENADIITILMGENGDLNFVNRIKGILRDRCLQKWLASNYSCSTNLLEAYSAFIISGCVGIVQYWLESGMKESPEQMAKATEDFILRGIRVLEK